MRNRRLSLIGLLAAAFALPALAGQDVALRDLPPQVRTAVIRETKGALIEDLEREKSADGVVFYEVEFEKDRQEWTIHVAEDGTVILREQD
jgi:hypothetical protein